MIYKRIIPRPRNIELKRLWTLRVYRSTFLAFWNDVFRGRQAVLKRTFFKFFFFDGIFKFFNPFGGERARYNFFNPIRIIIRTQWTILWSYTQRRVHRSEFDIRTFKPFAFTHLIRVIVLFLFRRRSQNYVIVPATYHFQKNVDTF